MRIRCPKCNSVYVVDGSKTDYTIRKAVKCSGCHAVFYVELRQGHTKRDEKIGETTFLQSYFEKRNGSDRRQNKDRYVEQVRISGLLVFQYISCPGNWVEKNC